jgi:hypothetical protein
VYVRGNLAYAWDAGDAAGRRFAAVSPTRITAATQLQVAAAFAVNPATLRRWETRCSDAGVTGLLTEHKSPKRKSKLTPDTVAAIPRLRAGGRPTGASPPRWGCRRAVSATRSGLSTPAILGHHRSRCPTALRVRAAAAARIGAGD